MTQKTRSLRAKRNIFRALSFLANVVPLLVFTIMAFVSGEATVSKLGLSCTLVVVIILSLVAWTNKIALRSRLWILLFGLWFCLDSVILPIVVIGSCQVLDELVLSPLSKHYGFRYGVNKEIDQR